MISYTTAYLGFILRSEPVFNYVLHSSAKKQWVYSGACPTDSKLCKNASKPAEEMDSKVTFFYRKCGTHLQIRPSEARVRDTKKATTTFSVSFKFMIDGLQWITRRQAFLHFCVKFFLGQSKTLKNWTVYRDNPPSCYLSPFLSLFFPPPYLLPPLLPSLCSL